MFRNLSRKLFGGFSFKVLFFEFVIIVMAIFLGNLAADWSEHKNKKREAQESLELMCEELAQNYHNLKYYQQYYHRMIFLMDSLEAVGQFETLFDLPEFKSINPPLIYTFAYEMAKSSSKLANIDHQKAMTIYRAYTALQGLSETIEQSQFRLLSGEIETAQNWRMTFNFYREPIELFYRNYPLLQKRGVCQDN